MRSTFPGRLKRLKATVQSLVGQSCLPDTIYVFVSDNPRTKKTGLAFQGAGDGIGEGILSEADRAYKINIKSAISLKKLKKSRHCKEFDKESRQ